MSRYPHAMLRRSCFLALHCASWVVPEEDRHEWLREWVSELWHIGSELEGAPVQAQLQMAAFVRGAFPDAFWIALHARRTGWPRLPSFSSPAQCLFALFLLGAIATGLAFLLPGTRGTVLPSPYNESRGLVLITPDNQGQSTAPSIRIDDFRQWRHNTQHLFTELAFYQMLQKRVHVPHGASQELSIARASSNLFDVLGIQLPQDGLDGAPRSGKMAKLLLSDAAWHSYFHDDSQIVGRTLTVAGERVIVSGVIPRDAWRLPGNADAWLLESDDHMSELPARTRGYAVARMQNSFLLNSRADSWHMLVPNADGGNDGFDCVSVTNHLREPFLQFAFILMLALLALPATTSLPLGEYPLHPHQQSRSIRLRRWVFLTAKLTLILPMLCFASLDISQPFTSISASRAECIQLCFGFAATLFALRWVLRDQRRRCPVCLRLLQNPVHVGESSRNFLAWNGTELICAGGHGFLHIPELSTSWFSTQRWLYLDPSWRTLFRPPILVSSRTS